MDRWEDAGWGWVLLKWMEWKSICGFWLEAPQIQEGWIRKKEFKFNLYPCLNKVPSNSLCNYKDNILQTINLVVFIGHGKNKVALPSPDWIQCSLNFFNIVWSLAGRADFHSLCLFQLECISTLSKGNNSMSEHATGWFFWVASLYIVTFFKPSYAIVLLISCRKNITLRKHHISLGNPSSFG